MHYLEFLITRMVISITIEHLNNVSDGSLLHFIFLQRGGYPSRSPSPPMPEYGGGASYDPLYPLGGGGSSYHHKVAPPVPFPSSGGGARQRGITTATSMIISNLSDTVSKNDVAVSIIMWVFSNEGHLGRGSFKGGKGGVRPP